MIMHLVFKIFMIICLVLSKVILDDGKALEGEWKEGRLEGLVRQVRRHKKNQSHEK